MVIDSRKVFLVILVIALLAIVHEKILTGIGSFLVVEDIPVEAEAAVILHTGVDIYPRLIEAAGLYKDERAARIVINGNRKTEILRDLESSGYEQSCRWYADEMGILTFLGVPRDNIIAISAENAYDTVSEAEIVGNILINNGIKSVIITTSKFHSRRARHIWNDMYKGELEVFIAPANKDPFSPEAWWKSGRQIRWVLSEYGAWVYYYLKKIFS